MTQKKNYTDDFNLNVISHKKKTKILKEKGINFNKKKGLAICTTAMMVSLMFNPIVANAVVLHHKKKNETVQDTNLNSSESTDINSQYLTKSVQNYAPGTLPVSQSPVNVETQFFTSGNIANGTFSNNIKFSFTSKNGKVYNINNVQINAIDSIVIEKKAYDDFIKKDSNIEPTIKDTKSISPSQGYESPINTTSSGVGVITQSVSTVPTNLSGIQNTVYIQFTIDGKIYTKLVNNSVLAMPNSKNNINLGVSPVSSVTQNKTTRLTFTTNSQGIQKSGQFDYFDLNTVNYVKVKLNYNTKNYLVTSADPLIKSLGNNEYDIPAVYFAKSNPVNLNFNIKTLIDENSDAKVELEILGLDTPMPNLNDTNVIKITNATSNVNFKISHGDFNLQQTIKPQSYSNTDGKSYDLLSYKGTSIINIYNNLFKLNADIYSAEYLNDQYAILNINGVNLLNPDYMYYSYNGHLSIQTVLDKIANNIPVDGLIKVTSKNMKTVNANLIVTKKTVTNFSGNFVNEMNVPVANNLKTQNPYNLPSANMYTVVKVNNPSAATILNSSWKDFSLKTDYKNYNKNNLTMIFGHHNSNQTYNSSGTINFSNSNISIMPTEPYSSQKNLRGTSDSIDCTSPSPQSLGIGNSMNVNMDYSQYLAQKGGNPSNNAVLNVIGLLGEGLGSNSNIIDGSPVTDIFPVNNYLYFNTNNITLNPDDSSVNITYIDNQNKIANTTVQLSRFNFNNGIYSIANSKIGVNSKGILKASLLPSFENELPPLNFKINGVITDTKESSSRIKELFSKSWMGISEGSIQNINGNVIQNGLLSSIQSAVQSLNCQVSGTKNDDCYQNVIKFNKETGNGVIKNTVTNNSELPTQICSIEGLPTTNGLASNYGLYSSKNLKSELDSISNISKGSVYLLPTKYLNQYRDLLYSKTTPEKGEIQKIIDTIAVPYKKGMDLSNYCGVIYDTGILQPKESASYDLGLNIDGVNPNEKQVLYTAFKYFDKTFNEGSISNINKIDLYKNVAKTVVTTQVQTESGQILVKPVTTTGLENTKIGYKVPNIPEGYHLVNITENGNPYTPNKNNYIIGQASPTHLVWVVAKNTHKYQLVFTGNISNVSYNVGTNEWSGTYSPYPNELTTSPIPLNGATESWESATPPTGYEQVGQPVVTTETTGTYNKVTTTTYTYKFAPIPKVTVTNIVELPDGTIMKNLGDSDSGYPNGNVRLATPNIPEGYHLVKAPTNTPVLFPYKNVNCIWVIAKNQTIVNCKYVDAKTGAIINGGTFTINGKVENNATFDGLNNPVIGINKIPTDYREVGKIIFTESQNAAENPVITAVQKLQKIENKVEYKAIDQNGKVINGVTATINNNSIILNKDLTNKDGLETIWNNVVTSAKTNSKSIPVGYKENGSATIITTKDSNGNITYQIVQHLIKLAPANVTTRVVNSLGETIVSERNYTGFEGDSISYKVPKIPKEYEIIGITDNGKPYTPNTSLLHPNTGSVEGSKDTQNIVWKVEKENTNVTVKYMNNNKEIGTPITSNIKTGTPLSSVKLICPKGYRIININVNGSTMKDGIVTVNALPTPNSIVVNLAKLHQTINVTSTYNGKDIPGTTITTNDGDLVTGSNVVSKQVNYDSYKNSSVSNIPNGFKQSGKMIVTKTIDNEGNQIVNINVPLEKIPQGTITTIVKDSSNNIIVPLQSSTGYTGANDTAKAPFIPAGYKIVSITNNGKTVSGLPKTFNNETQNIVWHVIKEDSVTTKIITENGKIITPAKTTTVNYDSNINDLIPVIPSEYTPVKVVYNNNDYKNVSEIPSKVTENTNITIIVKKIEKGTITTKVVTKDGQDLVPEKSYTGIVGTNDTAITPVIPTGWKLVKITNNGKSVQGLPTSYTNDTQNIIWIVEKIQKQEPAKVIVKIIDKTTGQEIGTPVTTNAIVGTAINSNYMPTIPTGYTNEGVTTDGTNTGIVPNGKVAPGINNIIVYVNKKVVVNKPVKETVTAKVVEEGTGKILNSNPTVTVNKGTPLNGSFLPTVQKGYKIDNITVNGVNENNGISGVINAPTNIVVTVSPIAKGAITVIVKDTTGNIVVKEKEATGLENSKDTLAAPIIPNGYKLVSITNNGVNCDGMPTDFNGSTQNIVYTVQKEATTVTTSVVTDNGVTLQDPSTVNAKIGVALDGYIPLAPKGYHVTKVEVNGIDYTSALDVNGNTLSTPNNIIVYVTKDAPIVPKAPSKPVIQNKGKITVTVKTNEGKILVPTTAYEGLAGAEDTASIPTIPAGYTLSSITNNGVVVNGLPTEFNDGTQNIIYTVSKVQKDVKITTTVKTENGKVLVNPTTVTGKTGNATGLDLLIPKGYHLVKITSNNQDINGLPSKFGKENQNIMIIVEKDAVPTKTNNTPTKKETPSPKVKEVPTTPLNKTVSTNQIKQTEGISPVNVNTPNSSVSPSVHTKNIEQNSVSANPKTGDSANIPFAIGILGAIAGLFAVNKKKKKDTTLNKNS